MKHCLVEKSGDGHIIMFMNSKSMKMYWIE